MWLVRLLRRLCIGSNAVMGVYLFTWRTLSFLKNQSRFFDFFKFMVRKRWKWTLTEASFVRLLWRTVAHVSMPSAMFFVAAYCMAQRQPWLRSLGAVSSLGGSAALLTLSRLFPKSNLLNMSLVAAYLTARVGSNISSILAVPTM